MAKCELNVATPVPELEICRVGPRRTSTLPLLSGCGIRTQEDSSEPQWAPPQGQSRWGLAVTPKAPVNTVVRCGSERGILRLQRKEEVTAWTRPQTGKAMSTSQENLATLSCRVSATDGHGPNSGHSDDTLGTHWPPVLRLGAPQSPCPNSNSYQMAQRAGPG